MKIVSKMDDGVLITLAHDQLLKLWMVFTLLVVATCNFKSAAAYPGLAKRKLVNDINPGFISVDCGATEDYIDQETDIFYESDTKYINTGTVQKISPNFPLSYNYYQQQKQTLRSFPNGTRNCYTLKPKQGRSNNYLVRATFIYGNYDQQNKTPVFDLYLGVNKWVTVGENPYLGPGDGEQVYEIIHVPLTDYIEVCLVNTHQGVPFISVLELRALDSAAYKIQNGALLAVSRRDLGVEEEESITRYPTDLYDRLWMPLAQKLRVISTVETIYTQSHDDAYKIPAQVLRTAYEGDNASIPYKQPVNRKDMSSNCYVYFHFAEVKQFEDGRQRELRINLNGRDVAGSVTLEYLKAVTIPPNDPPVPCAQFEFNIYAAAGSDLPPIINAYEVYTTLDLSISPTNVNDVNAIMEIKQKYGVNRNWQGDPCLASLYLWDGLSCSNESTPRITSLNLSSSKLNGDIASTLSKLEKLQSLDLSYNNIEGPVPDFLAQLLDLRFLNLAGNKLKGAVPTSLMEKFNDGTLQLRLDENPEICMSTPCQKKKKKKMLVIPVLASIIAVVVVLVILSSLAIYKKKRHRGMLGTKKESPAESKNQAFTYSQIVGITDNFRTLIGKGGFGNVYWGTLNNGTEVAVKMLSPSSKQGYKEFQAEVKLLMTVHHMNLVSLIGYCDEPDNMALIYEYLEKKDLKQHLSDKNMKVLRWKDRLRIAVDGAHGLEYLHNGCSPPIIHRDLKTANILLNENMQAKIADFGLSRVSENESGRIVTSRQAGTPGYLDPEFYVHGIFNKKSDVYCFGIVLLELITGKSAMVQGSGNNCHIVQWITPLIQRGDIRNIVDPRLEGVFNANSAWKILEIAMSCVAPTAIQRPDMSQVLAEVKDCLVLELPIDNSLGQGMEIAPSSR